MTMNKDGYINVFVYKTNKENTKSVTLDNIYILASKPAITLSTANQLS